MFYPLTINDYLYRAVEVFPDRIAVHDEPSAAESWHPISYADLAARAQSLAASLDELEVPQGGRVAILSHNSARMLASFYGVSGFGRTLVPINFRLTPAEIQYILGHSGAEVLLADSSLSKVVDALECRHKYLLGDNDADLWGNDRSPRPWTPDEGATATINYTSGTTSRPKGVELTHRNLWINAVTFGLHLGLSEDEVYLHTLPMFHANGWGMPFAISGMGGTHVVLRQVDGAEILRRVEEYGVTLMCGAPAVLAAILDAAANWDGPIPGMDRVRVVVAGAPPPTRLIERIRGELGWEFVQIYGLTETSPFITMSRMRREWNELPPDQQARLLGRAGAPALGVRMSVATDGELLVSSNHNLRGYWQNPEETERAQAGGVFHTGDGGSIVDGYVIVQDRKKDVIVTGGENVSSIEVEDVLSSNPAVKEVAVIGIPDEKWGEMVAALVVPAAEIDQAELIAYCRERLAGYKVPKRVEFRTELARTATGKLQKYKLREEYWGDRDRQVN